MLCQSKRVPRNKSYTLHKEIKPEKKREEETNYSQATQTTTSKNQTPYPHKSIAKLRKSTKNKPQPQQKPKHLNYTNPQATTKQDAQNKSPPNPSLPKNTEPHSNSNALPRLQSTKAEPTKPRPMTP